MSRGKRPTLMDVFFYVAKKATSLFPYKRLRNLEDINFILHLLYLSDILGSNESL